MALARKADALIEAGGEGGERLRLHRVPLEAFSTVYSFYAVLAGYEGLKWDELNTKEAEDQVLSLRSNYGVTVLHWAAGFGLSKLVGVISARDPGRALITRSLVHAKNSVGETPLHLAGMQGCEAVARVLLAAGADTDATDKRGRTPLHLAAFSKREAVARALLAAGADKHTKDRAGDTPLHLAQQNGNTALVALLS